MKKDDELVMWLLLYLHAEDVVSLSCCTAPPPPLPSPLPMAGLKKSTGCYCGRTSR